MHCHRHNTYRFILCVLLATAFGLTASFAEAHTPHDTIDALAIDNSQQGNATIYIVRAGRHVMRSNNGGASWKELVNGIDARFSITSLALVQSHENGPTQLYLATDGDGVYVSEDAGSSWSKTNSGLGSLRVKHLAISPEAEESNFVFAAAATGGLYKRATNEQNWQRVLENDTTINAVAFHRNQDEWNVYAGDNDGNVLVSTDKGTSWRRMSAIDGVGAINSIELYEGDKPGEPVLLLGTDTKGVMISRNGGASFQSAADWGFDKHVTAIALSPGFDSNSTVYASTWHQALLTSNDGGTRWSKYDQGLSTDPQADLPAFYSPYFRQISIAEADGAMYLAGFDGLFKSTNGGRQWHQIETEPVGNIWALSLSPAINNDFLVAATTFDAGAYIARNSELDWSINNRGLLSTRLRRLVFSPDYGDDNTVFSSEDEGDNMLRSVDGGKSWNAVNLRPDWYVYWKRKILGTLRRLGLPASLSTDLISKEERIRANPKGLFVSPDFENDRYLYVATRYRGNFESTDAGQSLDHAAPTPFTIWNLVMSPDYPADKTLFASSREAGIFRSLDAGATWQAVNRGLGFLQAWQEEIAADEAYMSAELGRSKYYDILLAISPDYRNDKTLFAAGGAGIFKSTNGGNSWEQQGQKTLPGNYAFAIELSPDYPSDQTVIVSIKGKGIFRSKDGGETFASFGKRLIADNHEMRHLQFSPAYASDETLYAASLEDVFRSTDDGDTWQLLERPVRYENGKVDVIDYTGKWERVRQPEFSASWASRSTSKDSAVKFSFVGTGVSWIGAKAPDLGRAEVYLDGHKYADVDQSNNVPEYSSISYAIHSLAYKSHELVIKPVADRNGGQHRGILIDAFDVIGNRRAQER